MSDNLIDEYQMKTIADLDASDRMGFIKKVYGILFVMLAFTAGFTLVPVFFEDLKLWARDAI